MNLASTSTDLLQRAVAARMVSRQAVDQARRAAGVGSHRLSPVQLLVRWQALSPAELAWLHQGRSEELLAERADGLEDLTPRFERRRRLGKGAQGEVYEAWDRDEQRPVALKLAARHSRRQRARDQRLLREGRVLATLDHPNLVRAQAVGRWQGRLAVALELVRGPTLAAAIEDSGPLPWRAATRLMDGVLAGVEAAHRAGVVHRDLKPQNVILEAAGRPRVIDFGLCRGMSDSGLTLPGHVVGTPVYMAPERLRSDAEPATPAADVFALGAVLYFLLVGKHPWDGASEEFVAGAPPSLKELPADAPRAVRRVVARALAQNPALRYRHAGVMRSALAAAATPRPRPPGRRRPCAARVRRCWRRAGGRAALLWSALGGVGLMAAVLAALSGA